ncbi:uncharacterized protein LY79DRAFT_593170 [Colletotrichum navitas]|uniref:Sodium/calcium exchanger membrane region domain-containing protein n=1 Tax=Colletotrichum navitas TaxID=681940 RepID=A0AAD8V1Q8_9PEZI|nr:uncharacterized protein LY79DRAFT_593170 [Colletotrichum navitas]KAK1574604.1 hypothetical protein LY79DRAFT_593170 [Colletotrichum navitas]
MYCHVWLTLGLTRTKLAVAVSALAQGRASLALGNIVGSAISNILGAFSLGLIFRKTGDSMQFDRTARIYSLLLFGVTTAVIPVIYFPRQGLSRVAGIVLIVAFAVYILSVGWAISRGALAAPEGSDSDGDSSSDDESDAEPASRRRPSREQQPLLSSSENFARRRRGLRYHIAYLLVGFLAMFLSGYVLSHAATNVADALGASEALFGIAVLAIGTNLPEKFVAVLSGNRGHGGILVANTVGSNIFLLSLCLGIVMSWAELAVLWVSTLLFTVAVCVEGKLHRLVGGLMLVGYIAFIVVEFAVLRRAVDP